jgi:hypothetical protein
MYKVRGGGSLVQENTTFSSVGKAWPMTHELKLTYVLLCAPAMSWGGHGGPEGMLVR